MRLAGCGDGCVNLGPQAVVGRHGGHHISQCVTLRVCVSLTPLPCPAPDCTSHQRTVLNILRDYKQQLSSQHHVGKGKREATAPPLDGGRGFGTDSASFTPSSSEEKRSDEAQADVGSPSPSPTPETHNGGTGNGSPSVHPTTEPPPLSAVPETGIAGGNESLGRDGSTYESGDTPAGSRPSAETAGGGGGGMDDDDLRSDAAQATAALAEETVAAAMAAATRTVVVMGETAATLEPSSLVVNHNRATRSDASPAPPPPSPVPLMKQASAGPTAGRRGGRLEESRLPGMKFGGGESVGDERGLEDVEGGEDEDPDQMAAVTRHHLAVVIHAQVVCVFLCCCYYRYWHCPPALTG